MGGDTLEHGEKERHQNTYKDYERTGRIQHPIRQHEAENENSFMGIRTVLGRKDRIVDPLRFPHVIR